jgi:PadR family transcriptional regulator PadR
MALVELLLSLVMHTPLDTFLLSATFMRQGTKPENTLMETISSFDAIRRGLLEFLVLKIISGDEVYAADILASLEGTQFKTQEGTLYPLLSRLRRESLLDYQWQESETGPPRKYYSLTRDGRKRLEDLKQYWDDINKTIKNLGK